MVKKIGFICEGESDKLLLEAESFTNLLSRFNLQSILVLDAAGSGNLLPQYMPNHLLQLKDFQADFVIIITDLDEDACITQTKQRINLENYLPETVVIIISVKAIEAWFLADSNTLSAIFRKNYFYEFPEATNSRPVDILKTEFLKHLRRGFGDSKVLLTKKMLRMGFSIEKSAQHPNCPSAKYFLNKLESVSKS